MNNRSRMVEKAAKLLSTFINVYEVTRRYGGAEEGGWYYNYMDCVEVYNVGKLGLAKMLNLLAEVRKKYEEMSYGNIYSVRGGLLYEVMLETSPGESQTLERPYYC